MWNGFFPSLSHIKKHDRMRLLMPNMAMFFPVARDAALWDEYDYSGVCKSTIKSVVSRNCLSQGLTREENAREVRIL